MIRLTVVATLIFCCAVTQGCSRASIVPPALELEPEKPVPAAEAAGKATTVSFYGSRDGFSGRKTAAGERFNPKAMTAAHRTLPFGTKVKITNPKNQKSVVVRINDRGPYIKGREYDLSYAAAKELGIVKAGAADVVAEIQ